MNKAILIDTIPNLIYLKIWNMQKSSKLEEILLISVFNSWLNQVALEISLNFEIVKYFFLRKQNTLMQLKNQNSGWTESSQPYKVKYDGKLLEYYDVFVDAERKNFTTLSVANKKYGYVNIKTDNKSVLDNELYFDSKPEFNFFTQITKSLVDKRIGRETSDKIDFYAKMPTLGSNIFFEYYSKHTGKFHKAFLDFAIKAEDTWILVEVKSKDEDYDTAKTQELVSAFKMYMSKVKNFQLSLILCQYQSNKDWSTSRFFFSYYKNGKWVDAEENNNLAEIVKSQLKENRK